MPHPGSPLSRGRAERVFRRERGFGMAMTPQELKAQKVALLKALPGVVLDRGDAVRKLIGRHEDFLVVTGLGGTASDVGSVTGDKAHVFSLGGAMGAACMVGLGIALAQPK